MHIVRGIFSLLCIVVAPILLLQGFANARILPGPLGWNGFWQAEVARAFLDVTQDGAGVSLTVRDGGARLAIEAWKKEPLATDALFVLAVNKRAQNDFERMGSLLQYAGSLDKRNRWVGALRLETAAQSGDLTQSLALIDQLSLANPGIKSEFVKPLIALLAEEGSVPILREVLERGPVWADSFWGGVPSDASDVKRMYELRRLIDVGTTNETDARLLNALSANEFYDETLEFWRDLVGDAADPHAFLNDTGFQPIGWRVVSTGERALTPRGEGQYDLYVEGQTFGEVARQLVQLQPGRYVFSADVNPLGEAGNVEVALSCAMSEERIVEFQSLDEQVHWDVSESCDIHWLIITGTAWERTRPLRAGISEMTLTRER